MTPEHVFWFGSGASKSKLSKKKEIEAKERAGLLPVRASFHGWQKLLHDASIERNALFCHKAHQEIFISARFEK
ncbi:MAG: hypothetical protein ACRBM6_08650 [Geminicoccales bacterium]